MTTRARTRKRGHLSRGTWTIPLAKLAEGPLHLRGKVTRSLAIPAHVDLVEGRAVERCSQVTPRGIAAVGLSPRQLFAQRGHPTAEGAQKAPAEVGLFKHQAQHLPRLPGVMHFFLQDRENRILKRCQWLAVLWQFRKPLRHSLPEVLHAEGEQLLLGAKIAEECAPGNARVPADFLYRRTVETQGSEQLPCGPLNLPKDELVFPCAKRPGILRFRPLLLAADPTNRFLHCMQIMAQSAVL
jgi:hypothetical protein